MVADQACAFENRSNKSDENQRLYELTGFSPKLTAGKRHRSLSPDGMAPAGRDQCRELDGNGF